MRRDHHWRLSQGLQLEAEGRLEEAREQYDLALQMAPDYAQAHINLLAVHGRMGRFGESEKAVAIEICNELGIDSSEFL